MSRIRGLGRGDIGARRSGLGVRLSVCGAAAVALGASVVARAADPGLLIEHRRALFASLSGNARLGSAAAINDDLAFIGAPNNASGGAVFVFRQDGGGADTWGWVATLLAPDAQDGDLFGGAVSSSGGESIVGARRDDDSGTDAGAAYVFHRDGGGGDGWTFVRKLVAPDGALGDEFGQCVSVSGGVAIVGAHRDGDAGAFSGSAYVFARDVGGPDNWGFVKKLFAPAGGAGDSFGTAGAVSGDTAFVGAILDDDAGLNVGTVTVFRRDAGGANNWGFVKTLLPLDAPPSAQYGIAVSVEGDSAIVGAWKNESAYLFERNAGGAENWVFVKKLLAPDAPGPAEFGFSVCVYEDAAVIGARLDDDAGPDSGAAYVFQRDVGGAENWGHIRKIVNPNAVAESPDGRFGQAVALSGDVVAGGAPSNLGEGTAHIFDGLKAAGALAADCDGDGERDGFALFCGLIADCNDNGRPDVCDIADGASLDANQNGTPDECEPVVACLGDLNGDGVVDTADLGLLIGAFGTMCGP